MTINRFSMIKTSIVVAVAIITLPLVSTASADELTVALNGQYWPDAAPTAVEPQSKQNSIDRACLEAKNLHQEITSNSLRDGSERARLAKDITTAAMTHDGLNGQYWPDKPPTLPTAFGKHTLYARACLAATASPAERAQLSRDPFMVSNNGNKTDWNDGLLGQYWPDTPPFN
jgi:hypothetical protein